MPLCLPGRFRQSKNSTFKQSILLIATITASKKPRAKVKLLEFGKAKPVASWLREGGRAVAERKADVRRGKAWLTTKVCPALGGLQLMRKARCRGAHRPAACAFCVCTQDVGDDRQAKLDVCMSYALTVYTSLRWFVTRPLKIHCYIIHITVTAQRAKPSRWFKTNQSFHSPRIVLSRGASRHWVRDTE